MIALFQGAIRDDTTERLTISGGNEMMGTTTERLMIALGGYKMMSHYNRETHDSTISGGNEMMGHYTRETHDSTISAIR